MVGIITQGWYMNFNSFSIRTKLIVLLSVGAIFALSISFIASAYFLIQKRGENSLHNLTQLAQITAYNMSASLAFYDDSSAQKMLEPLKINKNILNALVYTNENILFAHYIQKNTSASDITKIMSSKLKTLPKSVVQNKGWHELSVIVPINLESSTLGYIKIVSDTKDIKNDIENALQRLFIIGTLLVFIIILLSLKLHKIFTNPIYKLLNVMKEVRDDGNYNRKISTEHEDEFKDLFSGFSSMLDTIHKQNEKISFIHKQTRDSIEYSANIQRSLLPRDENIQNFFTDSFTLWQPKDTVGGDIYLFETLRHKDEALLMVIDCTGHGVPGAFVTMIVKAIEKEIVAKIMKSDFEINTAIIMAYFNKHMRLLLHQDDSNSSSNAGFDGGIVYINKRENILRYSGSNTPLFIVQNDKLQIIKGDKESIGYKKSNPLYEFKMHEVAIDTMTKVYLTTDGYLDQTGGEKGFLFGKKRFAKLVEDVYKKPCKEQESIFKSNFVAYKRENETKDDMTLVAFKITPDEEKA